MADQTVIVADTDDTWTIVVQQDSPSVAVIDAIVGAKGDPGTDGTDGTNGADGADGASAYDLAVAAGFSGTETEWLASLKGDPGVDGTNGTNGTDGADGAAATVAVGTTTTGAPGTDAAVVNTGTTSAAVLAFTIPQGIQGEPGTDGTAGADGAPGADGASAYELAVAAGFSGTESEWLASLVGPAGADGTNGTDGADGAPGVGVPVGGTSGQVLAKASGTDYDTAWVDQTGGGGATATTDLTDWSDTAPTDGQVPAWDGSQWAPSTPAAGGAMPERQTTSVTTSTLAADASEDLSISLAIDYTLLSVTVDGPARVRFYATTASRTADADRAIGTDPSLGSGLVLEYVAPAAGTYFLSPIIDGSNLEDAPTSAIPMRVTNTGASSAAITVSVLWLPRTVTAPRNTATVTTASLATGASDDVSLDLAKTYLLLKLSTDKPARVRIYATDAARMADADRPVGTDPDDTDAVMLEYVTTADALSAVLSPLVKGASAETVPSTSIPLAVTNNGSTGTVTVTVVWEAAE